MNNKIKGTFFGAALGLAILVTPTQADASFDLPHEKPKEVSAFANVLSNETANGFAQNIEMKNKTIVLNSQNTVEESRKNEDLKNDATDKTSKPAEVKTAIKPVEEEKIEKMESTTGISAANFAVEEVVKTVKNWRVAGEQALRTGSNLDSDVLFVLSDGLEIEVVETAEDEIVEEGWLKVKYKKVITVELDGRSKTQTKEVIGYINSDYIEVIEADLKSKVQEKHHLEDSLVKQNLTTEIKNEIEAELRAKEEAERKEREARLAREKAEQEAQERAQELQRQQAQKSVEVDAVRTAPPTGNGGSVLSIAARYLGTPYSYGASTGTTSVFDCSSFTKHVFAKKGITLPRSSAAQSGVGSTVSKSNLQPGDLVFFNTSGGGISHVGIYVGNGKFIGAQTSTGVGYASINDSYWGPKYVTAKRIM